MDKSTIVSTISKYLKDIENTKGKANKAKIVTEMFTYLCTVPEFLNTYDKFKESVRLKCKELLNEIQEFPELIESINKTVDFYNFEIDEFKNLKELNHIIFNQDCTIYEFINKDNDNIVIKIDNQIKGFKRSVFIDNYMQTKCIFPDNKKIDISDIDFLVENYRFYELINSMENYYFVVPYEMNMFIKKCKYN